MSTHQDPIWAYLIHLGYNMWSDRPCPDWGLTHVSATTELRLDKPVWDDILDRLQAAGANMLVIDLGEGLKYASHPELRVKGSWTPKRLLGFLMTIWRPTIAECHNRHIDAIDRLKKEIQRPT